MCDEIAEKPYFKRFSGIEKAHRNSIKITMGLCERATKRSRIEVKVNKSSVSAPFDKLEFAYLFFAFANATRLRIIVMETNATEAIKTARIVSSIAA